MPTESLCLLTNALTSHSESEQVKLSKDALLSEELAPVKHVCFFFLKLAQRPQNQQRRHLVNLALFPSLPTQGLNNIWNKWMIFHR